MRAPANTTAPAQSVAPSSTPVGPRAASHPPRGLPLDADQPAQLTERSGPGGAPRSEPLEELDELDRMPGRAVVDDRELAVRGAHVRQVELEIAAQASHVDGRRPGLAAEV